MNKQMQEMLAGIYEIDNTIGGDLIKGLIDKYVYKYTTCGCRINFYEDHITLSGYCEGSEGFIPSHELGWPFTEEEYWSTLQAADDDGVLEWDNTHGCETCLVHWQEIGYEDAIEYRCPIWKECPECGGEGEIL